MKIQQEAMAGTLQSRDLQVKVRPHNGLKIVINSKVNKQFGEQILLVVKSILEHLQLTDGLIIIEDKGALTGTIKARVECAIFRGSKLSALNCVDTKI